MSAEVKDLQSWTLTCDEEGYRKYTAKWMVLTSSPFDGPATVINAAGLPAVGTYWAFGNDSDPWAFCTPECNIQPFYEGERCSQWYVEQYFTNKPRKRCQDSAIENPLREPPDISGSFLKYTREAYADRFGDLLLNSSRELMRGSAVEVDANFPTVSIRMNQASIGLATYAAMVDGVNDSPLWGLMPRMVKLENVTWSRKLYGTCSYYYTLGYEFKINFATFDKLLVDQGSRILMSGGTAGKQDDYKKNKDKTGEPMAVLLDGSGGLLPAGAPPYIFTKQMYPLVNMLTLGIPSLLA
jgi:hypothetical protein